ncbi:MAG: hypothetical protein IPJ16_01325 [Bacteroidales bacterium]|nr:hypothetical protein [Bacteroidales bacterium]
MRSSLCLIILSLFFSTCIVSAQFYETGQDPASLKWMQIKTGRFTVIYPEKYDAGGRAFAKSLDEAYSKLVTLFPEKKFRIPVVIHNYSTRSNGYVAWAPKRMEIYPTPEQNTIPLDPNRQLAVHELTHVFQMEALNSGFSRLMTIPMGEQFTGIVASLLPLWFLEGDAVFAETYLTGSGRGRSPSFQKQLKALTVEKNGYYSYDKSLNGSYRNFVPDHYQYGYQMVTWSLAKYDPQIWNRVLKFTAEQPFSIVPVNISLNKSAGLTKKRLYREAFDSLRSIWTEDSAEGDTRVYETMNPDKKGRYINYYSPVFAGKDSIISIKTSLSDPPVFVLIKPSEKTEKRLHIPGQMYPWYISYGNGKIVWVETEADTRWENRDYSVIKILDLRNNMTRKLSRKTRYLSAAISPDGKTICAVENTISNINNLVLIESETGNILKNIPSPQNLYLQRPQWSGGGREITVIYLTESGEGIFSYSPAENSWKTLLESGNEDIQSSQLRNDSLYYITSQSGTDNVFLITPDKKKTGITRSRFGVSDLTLDNNRIIFSDYSSDGNSVCISALSDYDEPQNISSTSFLINRVNTKSEELIPAETSDYNPVPYRKWQHLFRFHSWMPFYADLEEIKTDPTSLRPGITLLTQNTLSTLTSTIGYEYSQEKNHVIHSRVTWSGWYPVIESQLDYGDDPQIYKVGETVGDPSDIQPGIRFSNAVSFPFRFSSGRFTEYLRPSFTSEYHNRYVFLKDIDGGTYDYGQTIFSGRVYFSNYTRSALRNIYPKWAQTIDLNYSYAPFDRRIYGTSISLKTSFFFPGLLPDNGIKIRLEKEKQEVGKYLYSNRASLPRGYRNIISKDIEFLSADYVIPLAYPDFNISSILYLKRIRTSLFYDYASGTGNYFLAKDPSGMATSYYHNYNETFKSFGFELLADFHILRIPYMISGGVQTAWKDIKQKPVFEILFNMDLFGMTLGKRNL